VCSHTHTPVPRMLLALRICGCHGCTRVDTEPAVQFFFTPPCRPPLPRTSFCTVGM
jgi:hypothetical protein